MLENRRNIRVKTKATISFDAKFTHLIGSSWIIDISEGGMCIPSKEFLAVHTILEIEMRSNDLKAPIKLSARIVRSACRDHGEFQFELGLEFFNLSFNAWKILNQHIKHCLAQNSGE